MLQNLSHLSEKIAKLFGEEISFGVNKKAPSKSLLKEFFEKYPLSSLLPYDGYDPETELFHNKKSMGFMLEVSPLTGASEQTVQILSNFLTDILPTGIDLQVILWASDKVGDIIDAFVEERSKRGDIFLWLAQKREAFLKKGMHKSLASDGSFLVRDFKLYLVVSSQRKNGEDARLTRLREELNSSLASIQMPSRSLPIEDFLSLMFDLLNPLSDCYPAKQHWNHYESLSLQMTNPEYRVRVYPGKLSLSSENENWEVRCFTVKDFPKQAHLGQMHEQLGQLFNTANQIPCPFVISFHVRTEDSDKSMNKAQVQVASKDSTAKSQLATFKPTITKERQDWTFLRDRLSEGDRVVKIFYQVLLYAHTLQADEAESKLKNVYKANGWKLCKQSFMQLQSWVASWPMMMSEGMFDDLRIFGRLRTMNAFAAVNLMPLLAEWKGLKRPSLLLICRRGQLAVWNPFDNQGGNYNVAIAAASGSGKSTLTQEYIIALLGSGARVWVIDVGRSYEKTCRMIGGEFIEFKPEMDICMNPFTFIEKFDESLEMLKPLIGAMARPSGSVSDEEMAWLEKGLKAAWDEKGREATITTVSEWLSTQSDPICQRLSHLLFSYSKNGMYGKYFEGACTLNIDNHFVVLELEELKAKKDLQKIVLFVLMYQISERMYLGSRTQQKSCVIDEAWDLLGGENAGAAAFIETGYRRARRYNANFVTITQSINDYFKNATSIAAYDNSAYKIILRQETSAINQMVSNGRMDMDEYSIKLLKSLKTTRDYAECMITSGQGISVHRIVFDPYTRILYSSKGDEFEAVKQLQAQGLSLQEAVSYVAERSFT